MKKWLILLISVLCIAGCSGKKEPIVINNPVEIKTVELDVSGYEFLDDPEPAFIETTMSATLGLFDGGTAIVFYGYPHCYWCNRAIPVANEVLKEYGLTAYYVDVYYEEAFDEESYRALCDKLGIDDMFVPLFVVIKNGKVMGSHVALVDSYDTAKQDQMSEEQRAELKKIYSDLIEELR